MRARPLILQVLAVNLPLMAGTVIVVIVGVNSHAADVVRGRELLVFGLAITATLLANWLLLRRRFRPLDELIVLMERIDSSRTRIRASSVSTPPAAPKSAGSRRRFAG